MELKTTDIARVEFSACCFQTVICQHSVVLKLVTGREVVCHYVSVDDAVRLFAAVGQAPPIKSWYHLRHLWDDAHFLTRMTTAHAARDPIKMSGGRFSDGPTVVSYVGAGRAIVKPRESPYERRRREQDAAYATYKAGYDAEQRSKRY